MYKYGRQATCRTQADIERGGGTIVKNTEYSIHLKRYII